MNEQSEIMTTQLEKMVNTGQEINIFKQIALCALDIICGKLLRNSQKLFIQLVSQ